MKAKYLSLLLPKLEDEEFYDGENMVALIEFRDSIDTRESVLLSKLQEEYYPNKKLSCFGAQQRFNKSRTIVVLKTLKMLSTTSRAYRYWLKVQANREIRRLNRFILRHDGQAITVRFT